VRYSSLWVRLPHPCGNKLVAAAVRRGMAIASGSNPAPDDLFLDHVRLYFPDEPPMLQEAVRRMRLAGGRAARRALTAALPGGR
jgi:hypothetical protein